MSVLNAATIIDALKIATLQLEGGFVVSPRSEAEMIVLEKTMLTKTELYLYPDRELKQSEKEAIEETVKERLTGRPLQYILGHQQFRYLDLICREEVLIPRPETELIVDAVLDELKSRCERFSGALRDSADNIGAGVLRTNMGNGGENEQRSGMDYYDSGEGQYTAEMMLDGTDIKSADTLRDDFAKPSLQKLEPPVVLDIGCGTGAIGLSVAHECPEAAIYMVDKSDAALALTTENMQCHNLQSQVKIVESDLFDEIGFLKGSVDIIVSNPPYIRSDDIADLQREVMFEPRMALDGGTDGLDYYKAIVDRAPEYLKKGGMLFFEVGYDQSSEVKGIIEDTNSFVDINFYHDYRGVERIVSARRR
jgi:release factor glutamine methyltransferase